MIGRRLIIAAALLAASPALAQQERPLPRVAIASMLTSLEQFERLSTQAEITGTWSAFFQAMRQLGYVDGENIRLELWSAAGEPESTWGEHIARIVASQPDLIVTDGSTWVRQLMAATSTIPIVTSSPTPLEYGIVGNLARPEGNVTGVAQDVGHEILAKHVQLLAEIAPGIRRVALSGPRRMIEQPGLAPYFPAIMEELGRQGLELVLLPNDQPASQALPDIARWLGGVVARFRQERIDAAVLWNGGDFFVDHALTARSFNEAGIPVLSGAACCFPTAGGLMAYGADARPRGAVLADYVDRILKGASPRDLPFQQPRDYVLVINQATSDALGLTIPDSLRILADEIIE